MAYAGGVLTGGVLSLLAVMVAGGCFADPNFPAPDTVTQTKYRQPWCPEFEGAEHYEEYSGK